MIFDVAIVGGGAAGLALAVSIPKNCKAVIFEQNARVGKKLLATGNGRGNISNRHISKENYHGDTDFAQSVLERFSTEDALKFFYSLGILTTFEEDRIYPLSLSANTILDCIRQKINDNIQILCGHRVVDIFFDGNFCLKTSSSDFFAKKVVVAAGGKSGQGFGTDGSAYSLLSKFGHKLTKVYPSLVQLKCKNFKLLKGCKFDVKCCFFEDNKHLFDELGEVLFCDNGISGNAIFTASSKLCRRDFSKLKLLIDFCPKLSERQLYDEIVSRETNPLLGICKNQLANTILSLTNDKQEMAKLLKSFPVELYGTKDFASSQVTAGGIACDFDVNFQSKFQKGLYAIGEILDVDGDCGGFNLHFAFGCGVICGKNLF